MRGTMIAVTGATGHLGNNLVRRLLDEEVKVRALVQPGVSLESLAGLDLEVVEGDLRDREALNRAFEGARFVFHTAAQISTIDGTAKAQRQLFEVNVGGTRNVLAAAKRCDVERVVMTGSFSATGHDLDDPSAPVDETAPFYPFHDHLPYARSKVLAEYECLRAVADGQDVVIATSCSIIGPNDFAPSRMGKTLCDFANGQLWAYTPGGFEFIRAADIVEGHWLALTKGQRGQKYIFHTEFLTLDALLGIFEEVTGQRRPRLRIPSGVLQVGARALEIVLTPFPKVPQRLTPGAIRILRMHRHVDTSKAERELGYRPTSMRLAVEEAYEFFASRGLIRKPRVRVVNKWAAAKPSVGGNDAA